MKMPTIEQIARGDSLIFSHDQRTRHFLPLRGSCSHTEQQGKAQSVT
jgi:hypothetical protein